MEYADSNSLLQDFSCLVENIQQQGEAIRVKSAEHATAPMEEIQTFRRQQYLARQREYLCEPQIEQRELLAQIDQRSRHFWVEYQGNIIACLRVTPFPFELMDSCDYFAELAQARSSYLEFGRFITATDTMQQLASRKLLAAAFLYACSQGSPGVLAICRTAQKRLFERFHLHALHGSAEILPERRGAEYWMLAGQAEEIMRHALARQQQTNTSNVLAA